MWHLIVCFAVRQINQNPKIILVGEDPTYSRLVDRSPPARARQMQGAY